MFDKYVPENFRGVTRAQFIARAKEVALAVGMRYEHFMGLMYVESKLRPDAIFKYNGQAVNPKTGYYYTAGLIQWTYTTAKELHGKTTNQIAAMNALEQLALVAEYFKKRGFYGRVSTFKDVVLAVHYPAGVGKSENTVLYRSGTEAYKLNAAFDTDVAKGGNKDGAVTVKEVVERYAYFVRQAVGQEAYKDFEKLSYPTQGQALKWIIAGALGLAVALWAYNRYW